MLGAFVAAGLILFLLFVLYCVILVAAESSVIELGVRKSKKDD